MSKEESGDMYQLLVERTGRNSSIVTSNDTGEWLAMFDDTLRAQSAVDRFINAAYDPCHRGRVLPAQAKATIERARPSRRRRPSCIRDTCDSDDLQHLR